MIKKTLFSVMISILILSLADHHLVFADFAGCNCVCGKFLRPPCGEDDCRRECGGQVTSVAPSGPSYDYEAERQAAAEAERQRQAQIDEEARHRQEEFEQKKEESLKSMKGITENELGLKGTGASGDLGLKGTGKTGSGDLGIKTLFEKPTGGAVPVDTRVKGPSKLDVGNELKSTGVTDSSVVDLRDLKLKDINKGLMKNQWDMSIDWRYKHDPVVQKYIHDLWAAAFFDKTDKGTQADARLQGILKDQMKANGRTMQEIDDFFAKVHTFLNGEEQIPMKWDKASKLAQELDGPSKGPSPYAWILSGGLPDTEQQIVQKISKAESVTADVSYMAPGKQTTDDCVLHAIANGAQVPLDKVNSVFEKTIKDLGMDTITERKDPNLVITEQKKGGRGGLNPFEELLVSEQLGDVIAVPHTDFAKVIENTGRPVLTSINMQGNIRHEVVVTGVYRTEDKSIFYRVMDSNLTSHENFTTYIERSQFYKKMPYEGGFVVVPRKTGETP